MRRRSDPAHRPIVPPWPPGRTEAPDPRPLTHPLWPAFRDWVASGAARVNPRLTDDAAQYGLHGVLLFEAFAAGAAASRGPWSLPGP